MSKRKRILRNKIEDSLSTNKNQMLIQHDLKQQEENERSAEWEFIDQKVKLIKELDQWSKSISKKNA